MTSEALLSTLHQTDRLYGGCGTPQFQAAWHSAAAVRVGPWLPRGNSLIEKNDCYDSLSPGIPFPLGRVKASSGLRY